MTDTWSDASTTYTAVKMNVTKTGAAAGSKLLDLQVGGVSKASIDQDGNLTLAGSAPGGGGGGSVDLSALAAGDTIAWNGDAGLARNSAGVVEVNTGAPGALGKILANEVRVGTGSGINLLTYSNDLTGGAWTRYNTTAEVAAVDPPPGQTGSVFRIVSAGPGTDASLYRNLSQPTGVYTVSFFLKAAEAPYAFVGIVTNSDAGVFVDLATGEVTGTANGATAVVTDLGSGWFRVAVTVTTGGTSQYPVLSASNVSSGSARPPGPASGQGVYAYGAQLEPGPAASAYAATTAAPAAAPATTTVTATSLNIGGGATLYADAANVLSQRNGTAAQELRVYNTVSGTGNENYERAVFGYRSGTLTIGHENGGTGGYQTTQFTNTIFVNGNVRCGDGFGFQFGGTGGIESIGVGSYRIIDNTNGDGRLKMGKLNLSSLPTSDPHVAGDIWNNGGSLMISAG